MALVGASLAVGVGEAGVGEAGVDAVLAGGEGVGLGSGTVPVRTVNVNRPLIG